MKAPRIYQVALFLCGAGLFVYLLVELGLEPIVASFQRLSWRLLVLLVFPCVLFKLFDTLGWRFAFPDGRVPLWTLAKVRLAGQSINATMPTGTLGGDAAKVWLLRNVVSSRESVASLIAVKTTMVASQGIFLLLGLVLAYRTLPMRTPIVRAMEWLLVLVVLAVVGFVAAQTAGLLQRGHRALGRVGIRAGAGMADAAKDVDRTLGAYYRTQPGRV